MLIDLSHPITESMNVYPGDPSPRFTEVGVIKKDGFCDHTFSMGTHNGTHVDALLHMIDGGKAISDYSVDHFVGRGVLIDFSNKDLSTDALYKFDIQKGDIVLLQTNMSKQFDSPAYFTDFPAITEEVAEYFVSKSIKMLGIDACSVDSASGAPQGFPNHKTLLKNDVLIIENLTNLASLEEKKFKITALPINIGLDGAPARVVAEIL